MTVVVQRSALKMWLMALGGIPLLVISLDVLTERRITRWLTDLIFRPEDVQIFEPRDVIYAWAMLIFGLIFVGWGLKELFAPTKVLECTDDGLVLRINGFYKPPVTIPWSNISDVGGAEIEDDGDLMPLFVIGVFDRSELPENPWGARWVGEKDLGVLAEDWADDPDDIADRVADYAVEQAKRERREATSNLWQES